MSRGVFVAGVGAALLSASCGGEPIQSQFDEPLRAGSAQFREGELPGLPPLTVQEIIDEVEPTQPNPTSITFAGALKVGGYRLQPGEVDKSVSGRTSTDGVAVGLRLADAGSGYWVVPVTSVDIVNNNELTWATSVDFSPLLNPGKHTLLVTAFDKHGKSGTQLSQELCTLPLVPDNGNICDPKQPPPALVASLEWDTEADLDLKVIAPNGKLVDRNHPSTELPDDEGNVDVEKPGAGLLDVDSTQDCVSDGRRRENLVFQQKPSPGTYYVYANLYDACGEDAVHFQFSLHSVAAGSKPDTYAVAETFRQAGELLAVHANGDKKLGTFVTEFTVQ
jgi:hypothetical protein